MKIRIHDQKLELNPGGMYTMVGERFAHEQAIAKLHVLQHRLELIIDKMLDCNELSDKPEDLALTKLAEMIYDRDYRDLVENYSLHKVEFPASDKYPITIPTWLLEEPWVDQSWHNDACPSFFHPACKIIVWVDYDNEYQRESSGLGKFHVTAVDVDEKTSGQEYSHDLFECGTEEELKHWLETATF
jgi:hypothetical protein